MTSNFGLASGLGTCWLTLPSLLLQTSQGVPVRRFQTLGELIGLYAQPNQGLVCALLLPVEGEREPDPPDDRDASGIAPLTAGEIPWTGEVAQWVLG